ncbi:MAG: hypothetical protein RJA63_430 [Pseudomonadota bacterium]|jgi:hypothetical protein
MQSASALDTAAFARLGARFFALGALGLIATSVFYVLAGPVAALPGGADNVTQALAATPSAAGWMQLAGLTGMPSDILLALGAGLFALHEYRRGMPLAFSGWLALAVASVMFVFVDAVVAKVLPPVAAQAGAGAAYAGLRALFDVLFAFGALTAGGGALAVAWRTDGAVFRWPAVGWGLRLVGLVCLLASASYLLGGPGAALIGPGIALLAIVSLGIAAAYAREQSVTS